MAVQKLHTGDEERNYTTHLRDRIDLDLEPLRSLAEMLRDKDGEAGQHGEVLKALLRDLTSQLDQTMEDVETCLGGHLKVEEHSRSGRVVKARIEAFEPECSTVQLVFDGRPVRLTVMDKAEAV